MMIVLAVPETKLLLKEVLEFCFLLIFSNAHYLQEYTLFIRNRIIGKETLELQGKELRNFRQIAHCAKRI